MDIGEKTLGGTEPHLLQGYARSHTSCAAGTSYPSPLHDRWWTSEILIFKNLTTIPEVQVPIPGYTQTIFLVIWGVDEDSPSLFRTVRYLLDKRSSEILLRKLKLRLRDNALLTTRPHALISYINLFSRCSVMDLISF